jgi:hypothetical protein
MAQNLNVIIVEKTGTLKSLMIKEYKEEELYKKCGFKKPDGFKKHTDWKIKLDGKKYVISVYGKTDGKANMENKYDFPPPIDNTLFFGSCIIICYVVKDGNNELFSLTSELWIKMYEKLFGGFEDLTATAIEDEEEEDELDAIPKDKKTKQGYLKDGFVIDSSDSDEKEYETEDEDDDIDGDDNETELNDELVLEDIGSELSEEEYSDEE